jgi:hypothetical protein
MLPVHGHKADSKTKAKVAAHKKKRPGVKPTDLAVYIAET